MNQTEYIIPKETYNIILQKVSSLNKKLQNSNISEVSLSRPKDYQQKAFKITDSQELIIDLVEISLIIPDVIQNNWKLLNYIVKSKEEKSFCSVCNKFRHRDFMIFFENTISKKILSCGLSCTKSLLKSENIKEVLVKYIDLLECLKMHSKVALLSILKLRKDNIYFNKYLFSKIAIDNFISSRKCKSIITRTILTEIYRNSFLLDDYKLTNSKETNEAIFERFISSEYFQELNEYIKINKLESLVFAVNKVVKTFFKENIDSYGYHSYLKDIITEPTPSNFVGQLSEKYNRIELTLISKKSYNKNILNEGLRYRFINDKGESIIMFSKSKILNLFEGNSYIMNFKIKDHNISFAGNKETIINNSRILLKNEKT